MSGLHPPYILTTAHLVRVVAQFYKLVEFENVCSTRSLFIDPSRFNFYTIASTHKRLPEKGTSHYARP